MYIAIIGDIISSKKLKNRHAVQKKLNQALKQINAHYKKDIASDFTITLGDEFQGLLKRPDHLFEIIDRIKYNLHPAKIRFGIGIGTIETEINQSESLGADGPAYWCARDAINTVHKDNDYERAKMRIEMEEKSVWLKAVNESLRMCDYVESTWSVKQQEVMKETVLHYGYDTKVPQKNLAEQFGVTVQAINLRIKSSGYYNYLRLKKAITETILNVWGEHYE